MVNYFDSISLYSWKMTDEQVSKFKEKLDKLEWVHMLVIQLTLASILSIASYIILKNIFPTETSLSDFWITFIPNLVIGILFLFGGYYFTKIFFKTELTVTQFYTILIYLYLPLLTIHTLINILAMGLSFVSSEYILFAYMLYIPMIYYVFKQLNTSVYLFKKLFNTNEWALVGVVFLWGLITGVITNVFNYGLTLIFL